MQRRALEANKLGRRVTANVAANVGGQIFLLLLVFFSTPYIIRRLGTELYGVLILLLTYVGIFGLMDLGINASLVKYVAEVIPRRDMREVNEYLGTTFTLVVLLGIVGALAVVASAEWIVRDVLRLPADLWRAALFGFWVSSVTFMVGMVSQPYVAVPIAAQRLDIANRIAILRESIRIVGSVTVVYLGYLLEGVVVVILISAAAGFVANLIAARQLVPGLKVRPGLSPQHLRQLCGFSAFVLSANVSNRIVHSLDKLIVGYFLPASAVAVYSVAYMICLKLWMLVGTVTTAVFPTASALSVEASRHQLRELYVRSSKIVVAVSGVPAVGIFLFSHELLLFWIGPEFAERGALTLRLLSVAFLMNCGAHVPYAVSQATGHPQVAARFAGLNAGLTLAGFLMLVPQFGIAGAAGAFLAPQIILTPWFVKTVNGILGVRWTELVVESYAPVALGATVPVLLWLGLSSHVVSLTTLLGVVVVGFFAYAVVGIAVILDRKERVTCASLLPRRLVSLVGRPDSGSV